MRTFAEKPKAAQQSMSAKSTKSDRALFEPTRAHPILHQQRTIGNQAVQRSPQATTEEIQADSAITASTRFGHDFSRISVHASGHSNIQPNQQHAQSFTPATSYLSSMPFSGLLQRKCACGSKAGLDGECAECRQERLIGQTRPLIQTKLTVGRPDDKFEQEADRVADRVMRMPEPRLQRQVEPEEEEEKEELLQAKASSGRVPEVPPDIASGIEALRGGGRPLPQSERAFFEPRFGQDFSQVRVHTGARAAETARAVNARACTVGRNVVFGAGQYAPTTSQGRRLLAHELTHVVQQSNSTQAMRLMHGHQYLVRKNVHDINGSENHPRSHPERYRHQREAGESNLFIQRKIDWKGGKIKSRRNVAKLLVESKGTKAQLGQTYPVVNSTKIKKILSQLAKVIPDPEIETKPIGSKKAECWVKNALNITGSAECDVVSKGTGSSLAWKYPIEKDLLNTAFGQKHCGGTDKLKLTITGKPSTEAIAKQVTKDEGEHTTEIGKAFKTHIGAYDKAVNKYVGSKNKITGPYEGPKLDFCKMDLEIRIKKSKTKHVKAWSDDMQKSIKKLDTPPSHHYKSKVNATAFCLKAKGWIKHA